jgi:hypothetical protein
MAALADIDDDAVLFWRQWENVAAAHPDVLKQVLQLAKVPGPPESPTNATAACLSGTSPAMRAVVNRAVTTVSYRLDSDKSNHVDLASTFPEAHHLRVSMDSGGTAADASLWLDRLASSSPVLLRRIHTLYVHLSAGSDAACAHLSVTDLLCR